MNKMVFSRNTTTPNNYTDFEALENNADVFKFLYHFSYCKPLLPASDKSKQNIVFFQQTT